MGVSCLHLHPFRVHKGRRLKHIEWFQRKNQQNHNFWRRLGFMKTWNYFWFLCEKDVYSASNIPGTFKASVTVALSNLGAFRKVCTKLLNRIRFTMSRASNFYFHFISICARNRASFSKSLLREQLPNLLNLYRGSGPRSICTFNWLHVSNMAVQKSNIIKKNWRHE